MHFYQPAFLQIRSCIYVILWRSDAFDAQNSIRVCVLMHLQFMAKSQNSLFIARMRSHIAFQ